MRNAHYPHLTAVSPNDRKQTSEQSKIVSHYCKKPGLAIRQCRKWMRKEQEQSNDPSIHNTKLSTSKTFAPCPHFKRTNHPPKSTGVVPMPLRNLNASSKTNQQRMQKRAKTRNFDPFRTYNNSLKHFKLEKPQLQWAYYTSVRQYIIFDPPTIIYHSWNLKKWHSNSCPSATNGKRLYSKI